MLEIYVWPDNSWMLKTDHCENDHRYKGDDFTSLFVEEGLDEDEITQKLACTTTTMVNYERIRHPAPSR